MLEKYRFHSGKDEQKKFNESFKKSENDLLYLNNTSNGYAQDMNVEHILCQLYQLFAKQYHK